MAIMEFPKHFGLKYEVRLLIFPLSNLFPIFATPSALLEDFFHAEWDYSMISLKGSKTNSRSPCDGSSRRPLGRAFFLSFVFSSSLLPECITDCKYSAIFFQQFFTRFPAVFHFFELVQNLPFRDT